MWLFYELWLINNLYINNYLFYDLQTLNKNESINTRVYNFLILIIISKESIKHVSYIFFIDHLHYKAHCCSSHWWMMWMILLLLLLQLLWGVIRGIVYLCCSHLASLENARKNYFILFLQIREWTSQSLVHVRIDTNIFIEFILAFSGSSSARSCDILSRWNSITYRLSWLLWWLIWNSWILLLTIIIEVIEHQIKVRINILCQMIDNFFFFIDMNPKSISWPILLMMMIIKIIRVSARR
jgi:hypothetical protein